METLGTLGATSPAMNTILGRIAALVGVSVALLASLSLMARPWYLSWGSTEAEQNVGLPGDELVPNAGEQSTRAITIDAPPERIWPWLAQTGQDRGGFHSYELLEDLVGGRMENLDYLDPALQRWEVGDRLWMYPPERASGAGHATLGALEPGRSLAFHTRQIGTSLTEPPDGSWAFVIEPIDGDTSRLLVRGRGRGELSPVAWVITRLVFEPAHFAMERKMMETLEARGEGRPVAERADVAQVVLWMLAFSGFIAAGVLVVMGRRWRYRLAVAALAGAVVMLLSLVQPHVVLGATLVGTLGLLLLADPGSVVRRAREPEAWAPILGWLLAFFVALKSVAGIVLPDTYARETPTWAAQGTGQDWVDLLLVTPWLVITALVASRGSRRARFLLGGAFIYAFYSFVLYALAVHFNKAFLVYCAGLGLSFFGLATIGVQLARRDVAAWFDDGAPVRLAGWTLVGIAVAFSLLWLGEVVGALLAGTPPASTVEAGLVVNPVHVLDLSLLLPGMLVAGVALLWRRALGYVLAPVMLSFALLMTAAIVGMLVAMRSWGVRVDLVVPAFLGVATVISTYALVRLLGHLHEPLRPGAVRGTGTPITARS